ncbi:MAG: extracellular solute-binding protein [Anaerolineales bacterium]
MKPIILFALWVLLVVMSLASVDAQPAPTEVVFWHHYADPARLAFWEAQAEAFNARQEAARVQVQVYPSYFNLRDGLLAALLNDNPPDVAFARPEDAALFALGGQVLDLQSYVASSPLDEAAFVPGIWRQDIYEGQRLGLPLTRAAAALYVNGDALRALGYDAPPRDWETLQSMSCAFAEAGGWPAVQTVVPVGFDIPPDAAALWGLAAPEAIYAEGYNLAGLATLFADMRALRDAGCAAFSPEPANAAQNRFASGQTLFFFASSAARPFVEEAMRTYFAEPFALEVIPLPAINGPATVIGGPSLSIFARDAARQSAAWAWLEWLAAPPRVQAWARLNTALPARQDIPAYDDWVPFWDAQRLYVPATPGYGLVADEVVFALADVLNGADPSARVAALGESAARIAAALAPVIE